MTKKVTVPASRKAAEARGGPPPSSTHKSASGRKLVTVPASRAAAAKRRGK